MAAHNVPVVRAVTYNIHRCIGGDGRTDPDRIVAVLNSLKPDIVALQEVVSTPKQGGGMLGYIAEQTGLHSIPGLTMLDGDGHYGNAMLSRLVPNTIERYDVSVADLEPRGILVANFTFGPKRLNVFATHLGLKRRERRFQITQLLQYLQSVRDTSCLVMGDWNEWNRFSANIRLLNGYFGYACSNATFPAKWPFLSLDKIWVTPPARIESVLAVKNPLTRIASDHLPLLALCSF